MTVREKLVQTAKNVPKVFAAGKTAEHDRFWDAYQQKGNRRSYTNGFSGEGWDDDTYNPKYDIIVDSSNYANNMFNYSSVTNTKVPIRGSNGVRFSYAFATRYITDIPLLSVDETVSFNSSFENATALENLTISGVIANVLNLQWATKLSKASIESVVNALSPNTSGLTVTFSKTAKEAVFTPETWAALIAGKENWTISLV